MKCKRSIFTVTHAIPVGKVFSYWVMVSIIQILVWLCSSTLVIFPKKSPRATQGDGVVPSIMGFISSRLDDFHHCTDEDLLDIYVWLF